MLKYLKEIIFLLGDDKRQFPILILLFIGLSLLEIIGIGMIAPYIALVLSTGTDINNELLLQIFSYFELNTDRNYILLFASGILIFVFSVKTIAAILVNKKIISFSLKQEVNLREMLMNAYQSMPYIDYVSRNSSEYIYNIESLTSRYSAHITLTSLRIFSDVIVVSFILLLLAWQDVLALASLVVLLLIVILPYNKLFGKNLSSYGKKMNKSSSRMVNGIVEGMEALKEIRILGKEYFFYDIVSSCANRHAFYNKKTQVIITSMRYIMELIFIVFIVLLVLKSLVFDSNLDMILPTLGMFGVAAIRILPIANSMSASVLKLRHGRDMTSTLFNDLNELFQLDATVRNKTLEHNQTGKNKPFMSIELVKINYSYNGRKKTSLSDISLEIKAGDSIGFMGPSGSGKTTLIDILLGLLTPEKGLILYNGQPLNSHISEWNAHVSYLPQEVFLIDDTLQSNIAFGMKKDKVDNLRLNDAIQKSQLDELVSQLDQGVDTLVGERGIQLSGGQRQRIALARAFYHERDVLIMDESTSAMDNEIEVEILKEILRLKEKKTVIIIAHRLTTLQHCDRIYKIMNGKIVEFGSYEELVLNSI